MNTPIVVKGLKNPDGTVITEFFGRVPVDFVAVRVIDGAEPVTINGLDNFKMSCVLKGILEERDSPANLIAKHGASLYVEFVREETESVVTNTVTQWLQTDDVIYTRKFENNAWGLWEEDSLMTLNKMRFFVAKHNLSDMTIIGLDDYKDYGLFTGYVNVCDYLHGHEILRYHVGATLYVKGKGTNNVSQFLQINKDIYTRDFDNETGTWGDWEKNTFSVEGHQHFGDDIFVGLDDTSLTLQEFAEGHNHNISDVTGLQDALDGKADIEHGHKVIQDEGASVSVSSDEDGDVISMNGSKINIELSDEQGGSEMQINTGNAGNLYRALQDPDETPTEDSDNFVTSGAVAAALAGKADAVHTHSMSNVDGLIGALAEKANASDLASKQDSTDNNLETTDKSIVGAINEIRASHGTVIEVDAGDGLVLTNQTPFGQMYHIDNSMLSSQINQIITTQEGGNNIHYHQGAGEMIADHFMIRVYRYEAEYFVEIAGAWDNIVPPTA